MLIKLAERPDSKTGFLLDFPANSLLGIVRVEQTRPTLKQHPID
jgi:hypothetical protein